MFILNIDQVVTERTLCYLIKDNRILLGQKKEKFGKDKYNGYGGKLKAEETPEQAAIRELFEEAKISAKESDLEKRATIEFYFPKKPEWNQRVHVYFLSSWTGSPEETKEMGEHQWFDLSKIPYHQMWDSDHYWLPRIIAGKTIEAKFYWKDDNQTIDQTKTEIREL